MTQINNLEKDHDDIAMLLIEQGYSYNPISKTWFDKKGNFVSDEIISDVIRTAGAETTVKHLKKIWKLGIDHT